VEQVVMKALAKDPKQRFANVQVFATAFEQASRSVPFPSNLPSQPIEPSEQPGPYSKLWFPQRSVLRRNMVLGLVGVGLAVGGGLAWLLSSRAFNPPYVVWYNGSYQHKKSITIAHTKVSGGSDLSDFPVLVSLTDSDLKTVASGGSVQNSN